MILRVEKQKNVQLNFTENSDSSVMMPLSQMGIRDLAQRRKTRKKIEYVNIATQGDIPRIHVLTYMYIQIGISN